MVPTERTRATRSLRRVSIDLARAEREADRQPHELGAQTLRRRSGALEVAGAGRSLVPQVVGPAPESRNEAIEPNGRTDHGADHRGHCVQVASRLTRAAHAGPRGGGRLTPHAPRR